jgi:hypothetical protein
VFTRSRKVFAKLLWALLSCFGYPLVVAIATSFKEGGKPLN